MVCLPWFSCPHGAGTSKAQSPGKPLGCYVCFSHVLQMPCVSDPLSQRHQGRASNACPKLDFRQRKVFGEKGKVSWRGSSCWCRTRAVAGSGGGGGEARSHIQGKEPPPSRPPPSSELVSALTQWLKLHSLHGGQPALRGNPLGRKGRQSEYTTDPPEDRDPSWGLWGPGVWLTTTVRRFRNGGLCPLLAPPPSCCVTMGKSLNLSEPVSSS